MTNRLEAEPSAGSPAGSGLKLVLVLGALIALGPLSIDMYLPALPSLARDLQTSASTIQLTLTGTVLGLGLGQLLVGPLSDAVGRRLPLVVGTLIHVAASLLCLVAPNVELLTAARVLQGLGASAGAVLALAVVRDLYTDRGAAKLLSRLILVMGVSPVLAPTIGSALLTWTDWHGVFVALAVIGISAAAAAALLLPETLPKQRRRPWQLKATLGSYRGLLTDRSFVGLVIVAGLAMAGLFAFVSGGAFVFQQQFGLDQQQFGLLFGASAIWLIAATQVNARLMNRYEPAQVLLVASVAASVAALLLVVTAVTGFGGLFGVAVPVWAVLFFAGLILPNAPAVALDAHGEAAGTAASLLGAVQFGIGAAISPVVGFLGNDAAAMAIVMFGGLLLAGVVLWTVVRPWRLEVPEVLDLPAEQPVLCGD
ncbi:MAG TPA: multidrug effflux MFS transporter [Amycolatopsis sp.]|nr:multidrug effflux MFS transporter [Amycolatopsis sp.]